MSDARSTAQQIAELPEPVGGARAQTAGVTERLVFRNGPTGRWAYLVIRPSASVTDAGYRLAISSRP